MSHELFEAHRCDYTQDDRQCTYNVTLGYAHVSTVAVETWKRILFFLHPFINDTIFWGKGGGGGDTEDKMCVSIFSTVA